MKKVNYFLLIFLVAFNLRLGISSVSPLLELIKKDLSLSNFQASLLTSVPVLCMGMMAFFVGKFQSELGRNKSISLLLFLLSISTLARLFLDNYVLLLFSALLIGFSIAIIGPLLSGFIKSEFPTRSGLLIGIYSLSMGLGSVIVSGTVLPLAESFDGNWRISLGIWGIFSLVALIVWKFSAPKETIVETNKKRRMPLKNKLAWKMVLFFGIQSGVFYSITTWLPMYFLSKNQTLQQSAIYLTLFTAIQMGTSFFIPTIVDKTGNVKKWIVGCCLVMLFGACLLLVTDEFYVPISLLAISAGGFFPIAMLLPIEMTHDPSITSVWVAMTQAFGYMIGSSIPILIGSIIDLTSNYNSFPIMIILFTAILFIIGISKFREGVNENRE